jgi:3-phosphoshikimate 1-carboxyvinyltransferase
LFVDELFLNIEKSPAGNKVMEYRLNCKGYVELEGSKSILARVLIISTFLSKPLKMVNSSNCNDICTLIDNLKQLGIGFKRQGNSLTVFPNEPVFDKIQISIKDSGTAFRFLLARLAVLQDVHSTIKVSAQLEKRPILPLIEVLQTLGADFEYTGFPVRIIGKQLNGGDIDLRADISSQFMSALMLIAPAYNSRFTINLIGKIVSRSYIEMTAAIMHDFGVKCEFTKNKIIIESGQEYANPDIYEIEPDLSSAGYFWALGALSNKEVCTSCISGDSLQSDFQFLSILEKMGANVNRSSKSICISRGSLKGIDVEMKDIPDLVPTLAVLALFANSSSQLRNIAHLQYKESNRIFALVSELTRIGANIKFVDESLIIQPFKNKPATLEMDAHHDHRLVMAFHILKAAFPYISINNREIVTKSYASFFDDFNRVCNYS